jgi:vancomycin resistance protein YoaR
VNDPTDEVNGSNRDANERSGGVRRALWLWSGMRAHWRKMLLGLSASVVPMWFTIDEITSVDVPRGVHVLGMNLSGTPRERAQAAIADCARARLGRTLTVEVDGKVQRLALRDAGVSIDVAATTARALAVGRRSGVFARFGGWAARHFRPVHVPSVVGFENSKLEGALARFEREALNVASLGGIRIHGDQFVPVAPRAGSRLPRAEAQRVLSDALESGTERVRLVVERVPEPATAEDVARLAKRATELTRGPLTLVDPESPRALGLQPAELRRVVTTAPASGSLELRVDSRVLEDVIGARRTELESAAVSARFIVDEKDAVHIVPSQPEARLDFALLGDAVLAAAESSARRGVLPLVRVVEPPLTTDGARNLGITRLLSTFTTRHSCCEKRVDNIHRIADLLDGLVVKPGETVSVNAVVGPRTAKNGFVMAPTIEEGAMVDSIGGGISQFATTFFNALFYGGFDIVERQPHTYWFPRYPMGHEATLSYPKPDLIFRNDTEAGMLIDTVYTNTTITVRIFGDNAGRKVTAEVSSRQNVVEPPVEIVGNAALAPDEEKTRDAGMVGWSVIVGRVITFPDGKKKEERRRVTYRPKPRLVEVHPCRVPKGEKSFTGERCPEPEDSAAVVADE